MTFPKTIYRVRLILGLICLIAGITFMIHSFLELRLNPILKPTAFTSVKDFGAQSYQVLHAKLPEKAVLVFSITNFQQEKDWLLGFLQAGQDADQREYILVSNETAWTNDLSQNFSFKGIVPTEDALESDSFVSPTYIVLRKKDDMFKKSIDLNLGAESKPEYQTYNFTSVPFSKDSVLDYKCQSRKRAFSLQSVEDLECFQLWMEKRVNRKRALLDLTKEIGALDQMDLRHYLIYYSK